MYEIHNKTLKYKDCSYISNLKDFPLTREMSSKNNYEEQESSVKLFYNSDELLIGIVIYEIFSDTCHIISLEVHKLYRNIGYGKEIIDVFKNEFKTIILHSLESAQDFYIKCNFIPQKEENYFKFTRK